MVDNEPLYYFISGDWATFLETSAKAIDLIHTHSHSNVVSWPECLQRKELACILSWQTG